MYYILKSCDAILYLRLTLLVSRKIKKKNFKVYLNNSKAKLLA